MEPRIVEIVAAIIKIIRILSPIASSKISQILLIFGILFMFLPKMFDLFYMSSGLPSIPVYVFISFNILNLLLG